MAKAFGLLLICLCGIACRGRAQNKFTKLVWQDEFDYTGKPDATKWGYDTATGCPNNCGWGNNELQYYTTREANAKVENGMLKITAFRESYMGAAFTSARLVTRGKHTWKYGKVEVRAKLPQGIGTWPAIWMLGSNVHEVGWPLCGEIDIMEHRGYELNKIFGTLHYPGRSGDNANTNTRMVENTTSNFHIYTLEWSDENISMKVDGQLVHEVKNGSDKPFHHDFYLLLNMAMGGGFAGPVDPAFKAAIFEIDYVRVYQ